MDLRAALPVSLVDGIAAVPGLVTGAALTMLRCYVSLCLASGRLPAESEEAYATYGDPAIESLFAVLDDRLARYFDGPVDPSYGYLRVYLAGAELKPHVDREACEYTLSMHVMGMEGGSAWPLYARTPGGAEHTCPLRPGDGVLMRGREVRHWREPLGSGWAAFVFLHWVAQDCDRQPNYDGRPGLGFPSSV